MIPDLENDTYQSTDPATTAVRYHLAGADRPNLDNVRLERQQVCDVAASFQEAVVDCLLGKAELALRQTGFKTLCVGGGVAANNRLRDRFAARSQDLGVTLHIPPPGLCTDNAVMGAIAVERFKAGRFENLDLDVYPGLVRTEQDMR